VIIYCKQRVIVWVRGIRLGKRSDL
jgi:hypothetical protein